MRLSTDTLHISLLNQTMNIQSNRKALTGGFNEKNANETSHYKIISIFAYILFRGPR